MIVLAEVSEVPSVVEQEETRTGQRPAAIRRSSDVCLILWMFMLNKSYLVM
jgi:hypothetical protein